MIFDDKTYIAKKIKEYRKRRGLTQAELAEMVDIGTKQISRIEIAEFYPSLTTFFKIVEVLNIDLSEFVTAVPDEKNKIRKKLISVICGATDEQLSFYDRLIMFANDEAAELKKNILLKRVF